MNTRLHFTAIHGNVTLRLKNSQLDPGPSRSRLQYLNVSAEGRRTVNVLVLPPFSIGGYLHEPFVLHFYYPLSKPRMTEEETHFPATTTCKEVQRCSHDHSEDGICDRCHADDKDSNCEPNVEHGEDSCCGRLENQDVCEEAVHETESRGMLRTLP